MNQEDIIRVIHDKCNMELPKARKVWKSMLEQMKYGIVNDGELCIRRFGRFKVVIRENNGRWSNPRTKEKVLKDRMVNVAWKRSQLLVVPENGGNGNEHKKRNRSTRRTHAFLSGR